MPIGYLRSLTDRRRSPVANRRLARVLCFVAGAANAGGFLAVRQYTSHMSGIVSAIADDLVLHDVGLVLHGIGALVSFLGGAACSAVMISWARRTRLRSEYALPLMFEAFLLLVFGVLGAHLGDSQWLFVPATVMLLCFMMGLQNAMISKLSNAEIRTTHVTGMITDIGVELGKLFYWNGPARPNSRPVHADRARLRVLGMLVSLFLFGGVAGAMAFGAMGYAATLPLAALLLIVAIVPIADDFVTRIFVLLRRKHLARRARRWGSRR
ncbi:Uncharacterized membrane protein YoaK, UPF0700 family [Cupriavidus sp. YR651]|nr:Uncharacterized membrane protein YoaK, UPF0700 family [Cupriavidus sp. YR651]